MKTLILALIFGFVLFLGSTSLIFAQTYTATFTKDNKTYIVTKTVQGDKVIIETKIYDESGNLLDTNVVEKVLQPPPVKQITYPTKTIIPTITKKVSASSSPTPIQKPPKSSVSAYLQTDVPIEVSSKSGNLVAKTASGEKELTTTPEAAMKKAEEQGLDIVAEVKLVQGTGGLQYLISGTKKEKFLALMEVYLPTSLVYNVENGGLESVQQSSLIKLADLLSI